MSVRYDYFAAPSDDVAAKVISDGPQGFRTVETKWLDPVVVMGQLEELLTGRTYADVIGDPRCGRDLAVEHGGELVVFTVTDGLRDGLVNVGDVGDVAVRWAGIEELQGFEAEDLREILDELAALARAATERGERLYCWVCV